VKCPECDGSGRLACWATDGRELYESTPVACDACRGRGQALCAACYEIPAVAPNVEGWPMCIACARWEASIADTQPAPPSAKEAS
jgi:hypothetical protein